MFCCRLWLTVHSSDLCVRKQCDVIELYCLYDRFWGNPCYTHFLTFKFGKNAGCWYSSDLKVEIGYLRERKNHKQNLIETFLGAIPSRAVLLRLEKLCCLFFFFSAAFATVCWNMSAHVLSLHIFLYPSDYIYFLWKCTSTHGKSRYVIGMEPWVSQGWRGKQRYFFSLFD